MVFLWIFYLIIFAIALSPMSKKMRISFENPTKVTVYFVCVVPLLLYFLEIQRHQMPQGFGQWFFMVLLAVCLWIPGLLIAILAQILGQTTVLAWIAAACWWTSPWTTSLLLKPFSLEATIPMLLFLMLIAKAKELDRFFWICVLCLLSVHWGLAVFFLGYGLFLAMSYVYPPADANPQTTWLSQLVFRGSDFLADWVPKSASKWPKPILSLAIHYKINRNLEVLPNADKRRQNLIAGSVLVLLSCLVFLIAFKKGAFHGLTWQPHVDIKNLLFLYVPLLFIPLFQWDVFLISVFLVLSQFFLPMPAALLLLMLWVLALYGMIKNQLLSKALIAVCLAFFPLFCFLI